MAEMNTKVQMIDAGMRLVRSSNPIGTEIGRVRAVLSEYGKVYMNGAFELSRLPDSAGDFDLFVDMSSFWRFRYLTCKVEAACEAPGEDGKYVYAITLRQGDKSTVIRGIVMAALILCCLAVIVAIPGFIPKLFAAAGALAISYWWILPDSYSRRQVTRLLHGGLQGNL